MLFSRGKISGYTDEELLSRFREEGQEKYFGELYNRYIPLIYGLCLKYLRDPSRSEDAVMQIFESLMNRISGYEINTFRTWIYSVAKNHCLQELRKGEKEVLIDFNTQFMESEEIVHLFAEEDDHSGQLRTLNECLDKLPEPQRIAVSCFFMDEMSYADIVDKTGFQLKSVKSYIQNGKRNLKICMEKNITVE